MKKKIAVFIPNLSGKGGMETAIHNLYSIMENDTEYDFTFVFVEGVQDTSYLKLFDEEKLIYHPQTNIILEFLFLRNVLEREKFDILIGTSKRLMILLSYLRKIMFINPIIISWLHFSISKEGIYVDLSKYGDAHFAISNGMALQMSEMGVDSNKIYYLPNSVDVMTPSIVVPRKTKFIYIGRIQFLKQKNLKELIDGLALLKFEWSMDVYGDGEDRSVCEDYINDRYPSLRNKVSWKGWVKDPWVNISEATALLLTSSFEGMPMVLIEAISRGLPILSSNCPTGPEDIVKNGENGYLYKLGDIKDFSEKLSLIVNTNFDRKKIVESSYYFNSESYRKRLKNYLNELSDNNE